MAFTEIPLKEAPASPPAGNGSYSPGSAYEGEAIYDAPVLLVQLQDELARSRVREAFWISLFVHLLVIVAIINLPKMLPRQQIVLATPSDLLKQRQLTYLELPPDLRKSQPRPNSDVISDQNRIAASRHPTVDRKTLQKILDSGRPGTPRASAIHAPQASKPQASAAANPPAVRNPPKTEEQPPAQTAKLEPPRVAETPKFGGAMSPGTAIEEAARAAAANRGGGGYEGPSGDYGSVGNPRSKIASDVDVVSDTMGVDFGPYLSRVLHDVRLNWYNLIPEVAREPLMKKGKVSVEFAILKDGHVAGMRLVSTSGDVSLDRAAIGGVTGSNPFPPLPNEFRGEYLALRFHFFYNPDKNELQ